MTSEDDSADESERRVALDVDICNAIFWGNLSEVKQAIKGGLHVDTKNNFGNTMLHVASRYGQKEVVQYLSSAKANSNIQNCTGDTPLHYAAENNSTEVVKLLVEKCNAITTIKNEHGDTPIHLAALKNHVKIIRLLVEDYNVPPDLENNNGNTPLHSACFNGSTEAVSYLLGTGKVEPTAANKSNQTPFEIIPLDHENRFDIIKLFLPFNQYSADYPIDSYVKVFLCGNTATGKSSLAHVLIERAKKGCDHKFDPSECITGVMPLTAGVNAHMLQSHEIGNVILYDLAGHREYYNSHVAVFEHLMLRSPAVFSILFNLTDDDDDAINDLYYWLNFVGSISTRLTKPSEVIVIGSHADLKDSSTPIETTVGDIVTESVHRWNFSGYVAMDCHRPGGKGVDRFVTLLAKSCEAVLDRSDSISCYCHVLYAFLLSRDIVAISLDDLSNLLEKEDDPSLPSNQSVLLEFLTTLSDKGLILFLRRDLEEHHSWIIVKKDTLLEEVNGTLFAPASFKRVYRLTASNTGVVSVSALATLFPKYKTDMLVSFLTILEFCHVLNPSTLVEMGITTNLSPISTSESKKLLYIPALVKTERPADVFIDKGFGWCLWCNNPHQFFSTRFLFVLLLRIAFKYCLPKSDVGQVKGSSVLARRCILWKDGIYWISDGGIKVIVQFNEGNRRVTVLISHHNPMVSSQLQSKIINDIFRLHRDTCPSFEITECLILPACVKKALTHKISDIPVFVMTDVARALLLKNECVTDDSGMETAKVVHLFNNNEPYSKLCPLIIKKLFNKSTATQNISPKYLKNLVDHCPEIMRLHVSSSNYTYQSVRDHLNKYSIFSGRNPFDIAYPHLTDEEIERTSTDCLHCLQTFQDTNTLCSNKRPQSTSSMSGQLELEHMKKVFQTHYAELCDLMSISNNRLSAASNLFSAQLISNNCYDNVVDDSPRSDQVKGHSLMNALRATINAKPQLVTKLINILERIETFETIADKIKHDLEYP